MTLSLVQTDNWTNPTEAGSVLPGTIDDAQTGAPNDMICKRHKGTKLALLIHMIDGFVIEESNVPFKGDEKEEEIAETAKPVADQAEKAEKAIEEEKENEIVNASMNSYPQDKDELMSLLPTSCKYCGGPLPEDRAMWGKRFCSVSCSKKYSVTCSQRVRRALHHRRNSQCQSTPSTKEYDDKADVTRDMRSPVNKKRRGNRSRTSSISETVDSKDFANDSSATPRKPKVLGSSKFENIDLNFTFPPREPLGFGLNVFDVEDDLFEGIEPIMKFSLIPMITWSTYEVYDYITNISGCSDYAKSFREEEIDGQALLLLKVEHMIHTMNLKLGPALKIASHLRLIKMQYGVDTNTKYLSSPV